MAEHASTPPVLASGPIGKLINTACSVMAWAAGLMFLTEMVMSSVSVLGRSLFGQGIPGDYELVQMLSAMGIAMCLPYCQLRKGHVFVDFFTLWAPASIKRYLDAFGGILLAGCAFLLAWRIWQGMLDMREYEETSMVLGLPIWWGYIPVVPAFALLGVTALHTASNEFCKGSAS
jgi:TRAP-type C4-dicarboxylate transport system permease small subunit